MPENQLLTDMDFKELKEFIKSVAKSGVSEVDIKTDKLRLTIKVGSKSGQEVTHTETIIQQVPVNSPYTTTAIPLNSQFQQPYQQPVFEKKETKEISPEEKSKYIEIKAPMVGTLYRRPSPDKPFYVNVGDTVGPNSVVCMIEAMKLFNEIESEVRGKIVKVLVEDSSPVEFDQPLYLVDPS